MKNKIGYKFQLITAWGVALLVILEYILFYLFEYSGGLSNKPSGLWCLNLVIMESSQVLLLLASVVTFLIIRTGRRLSKKQQIIGVFSISVALSVFLLHFPLWRVGPCGAQIFLKGFEKWVTKQVDTESIQTWISSADEKYWQSQVCYYGPDYLAEERFPKELADFLKDFEVKYIYFERSNLDNSKTIHFEWGGGMFHWSLVIGDPNMMMPEKEIEWFSDYDVEYRRILKPGVYIFSRG